MKKTIIKLIICAAALLCAATLLASCAQNTDTAQNDREPQTANEPTTADENDPTQSDVEVKSAEEYVETARECEVPFEGSFLITGEEYEEGKTSLCRLPQLTLDSADAQEINREIHETLDSGFDYCEEYDGEGYYHGGRIDYLCFLNSDVLSLVIETRTTDTPNSYFYVYNIDVTTGSRLSSEEVIGLSTVSADEAYGAIYTAIEKRFTDNESIQNSGDFGKEQMERSLSDENLKASGFYFNDEGRLIAAYRYYWIAGAGDYGDLCGIDAAFKG